MISITQEEESSKAETSQMVKKQKAEDITEETKKTSDGQVTLRDETEMDATETETEESKNGENQESVVALESEKNVEIIEKEHEGKKPEVIEEEMKAAAGSESKIAKDIEVVEPNNEDEEGKLHDDVKQKMVTVDKTDAGKEDDAKIGIEESNKDNITAALPTVVEKTEDEDIEEQSEKNNLLETLSKRDSIMERNILSTINKFLQLEDDAAGPIVLVEKLSDSYRGHAQMSLLVAKWLATANKFKKKIANQNSNLNSNGNSNNSGYKSSGGYIYKQLKDIIIQRYEPKLLLNVLNDSAVEPEWLTEMLKDEKWRRVLIELAEKHKSCGVLRYAIQRISEAGHHKEISSMTNANAFFPVFNGVLSDSLTRIICGESEEVKEYLVSLCHICTQTTYTYMYVQELLEVLRESLNTTSGTETEKEKKAIEIAKWKISRIEQEIQQQVIQKQGRTKIEPFSLASREIKASCQSNQTMKLDEVILDIERQRQIGYQNATLLSDFYSKSNQNQQPIAYLRRDVILQTLVDAVFNPHQEIKSSSHKEKCVFLLARAVSGSDDEVEETSIQLQTVSEICKSDRTLTFNLKDSGLIEKLSGSMVDYPVVTMGVLHWISFYLENYRSTLLSSSSTLFQICFESFLDLCMTAINHHPLTWPTVFQILQIALQIHPDINPVKALEMKGRTLKCMVHMMTCGYIFPVLSYITENTEELDQSLLRNFITFVMARTQKPFSLKFGTAFLNLLSHEKLQNALKSSPAETKKNLLSFLKYLKHNFKLPKPQSEYLKQLKSLLAMA